MRYRLDKDGKLIPNKNKEWNSRCWFKKYNPAEDPAHDYQRDRLHKEVFEVLEEARYHRGNVFIDKKQIDKLIALQAISDETAIMWLKYLYIGSASYLEYKYAEKRAIEYNKEKAERNRIDIMQQQLCEMQLTLSAIQEQLRNYVPSQAEMLQVEKRQKM